MVPLGAKLRIPTRRERPVNCQTCDTSFYVSMGYSNSFFSANCETKIGTSTNDDDDGCFHGNCVVSLANELTKLVKDIRRGDVLRTPDGSQATVTYVTKILRKNKNTPMVRFDNGLIITPWHPVRINSKWAFPHDVGHEIVTECEEVYNFALNIGHIIIINGIECVTLGHHFKGDVIEHPYFRTNKVLDDLRAMDIFNDGFIKLLPNSTVRSKETGLVSGIRRCASATNAGQPFNLSVISYHEHV